MVALGVIGVVAPVLAAGRWAGASKPCRSNYGDQPGLAVGEPIVAHSANLHDDDGRPIRSHPVSGSPKAASLMMTLRMLIVVPVLSLSTQGPETRLALPMTQSRRSEGRTEHNDQASRDYGGCLTSALASPQHLSRGGASCGLRGPTVLSQVAK